MNRNKNRNIRVNRSFNGTLGEGYGIDYPSQVSSPSSKPQVRIACGCRDAVHTNATPNYEKVMKM